MLTEAPIAQLPSETLPQPETLYDADSFCDAYKDVISLVKHGLMAAEARFGFGDDDLQRADTVIHSDQLRSHLEQALANGNYPDVLADEQMRSLIIEMACIGTLGKLVDTQLQKNRLSVPRLYKERVIEMNHAFANLADSELGSQMGLGRSHLRELIGATLGAHPSSKEVVRIEKGIAVEVGTKRSLENLGQRFGVDVRWATADEDSRNIDVVCMQGEKRLDIQVKSNDLVGSVIDDNQKAFYTPMEEYGIDEYRVRQLSPAADTAIGENFEVRAPRYTQVIEQLLDEFDQL
jgi:hypothetical protein